MAAWPGFISCEQHGATTATVSCHLELPRQPLQDRIMTQGHEWLWTCMLPRCLPGPVPLPASCVVLHHRDKRGPTSEQSRQEIDGATAVVS